MTSWAAHERTALVDALAAVGPDAPTLCEGWTAHHLAAHVFVRERRPDAALGVLPLGPLSAYTERVMASVMRTHDYDDLLERLRTVPAVLRVLHVDELINTVEFFVHTEDVRRPNGRPDRQLPDALERTIWGRLSRQARLSFRGAKTRIRLVPTLGDPVEVGPAGTSVVELRGKPSELMLFAFNRKDAAHVDVVGEPGAVEHIHRLRLGL